MINDFQQRRRDLSAHSISHFIFKIILLWIALASGAAHAIGTNTGLAGDDTYAGSFPIGFTFNYYGQDYTSFYATTNGLLQFGTFAGEYSNTCIPTNSALTKNSLMVFWDDLRTDVANQPNGKIFYQTIGDAPNRQLIVQWNNMYFYGTDLPMGTFEAILYESSNKVKFQYRYLRDNRSLGDSATIGIQGPPLVGVPVACNLGNAIHPEQAISFSPNANASYDVNQNDIYDFIDISGLTPGLPRAQGRYVKGSSIIWNWDPIPDLNSYQIEIGTSISATETGSFSTGTQTTYTQTGLIHNSTYYARARGSINNGGTWESWSAASEPVTVDLVPPAIQLTSATQSGQNSIQIQYAATDDGAGVARVRLQIATTSDFSNGVVFDNDASAAGPYLFTQGVSGQTYFIRAYSVDQAGNQSDLSGVKQVLLIPPPAVSFEVNPITGEAPLTVNLANTTTGVVSSYLWDFDNGQTSSVKNPSATYSTPGDYSIRLTATGTGGQAQTNKIVTVTPDVTPPAILDVTVNGASASGSVSISSAATLNFKTTDANGIQSVSALLGTTALAVANLGNGVYRIALDPDPIPNGSYALKIQSSDIVGNIGQFTLPISIAVSAPAAPVLTKPINNLRTNRAEQTVRGTAAAGSEAQLYVNGVGTGVWTAITAGAFQAPITLPEGENRLSAEVRSIHGTSERSTEVVVIMVPAPVAAFDIDRQSGEAPLLITLADRTAGEVSNYLWDFGNGQTSSLRNPSYTYHTTGDYVVKLTVRGIEDTSFATKTVSVAPDITPPVVGDITVGGQAIGASISLIGVTTFVIKPSDANGIQKVEAKLGDKVQTVSMSNGFYQFTINPDLIPNGDYNLLINVTDNAGNGTQTSSTVKIALAPPPAPTITQPVNNFRTNMPALTVRGSATAGAEAQVYVNNILVVPWVTINTNAFEVPVTLADGSNLVSAEVRNIHGTSARSTNIVVVLDTSKPAPVTNLTRLSQAGGKIHLTWTRSSDANATSVAVYRAANAFAAIAEATKLATLGATTTVYDDVPTQDGTYYYRLISLNSLGTPSDLTSQVQAVADSIAPRASAVYTPLGKIDAATGRIGQGKVNVALTVTEPLQSVPYFAVVPNGTAPISVDLVKQDDTHYTGSFTIDASAGSGTANVLFSGRDMVGNRGTDVDAGAALKIDTEGPYVTAIAITPTAPIKNDTAQAVTATFTLSKAMKSGETPQVSYLLSGPVRSKVSVTDLTQLTATTWRANFTLPSDAGAGTPETFTFAYRGIDDLDNISTRIATPDNRFQVYQGNLPPLDVPLGLKAEAKPGGKVRLTWLAVDQAAAYQIYRQGPNDATLLATQKSTGIEYIDALAQDGKYRYAVASVRQSNGQESLSSQSAVVEVTTITNAPGAPQNLALQLVGAGIQATWQPPLNSTVASYNLYRSSAATISSTDGLTPIKTGIKQAGAIDANPSPTEHAYAVTALDAAGNESAISNSSYLNFNLLPVATLKVEQIGNNLPQLSWTPSKSNNAGYNVYIGPDASKLKLTATPTASLSFEDSGYTSGERLYTVAVADSNGIEQPRAIALPNVSAQVVSGMPIKRGVMNKLQVQVTNTSSAGFGNAKVIVRLNNIDHKSGVFGLSANETRMVPVVVGGYADLQANAPMQVGVEIVPNEGELVRIAKDAVADIADGALVVGMATEEFTRGGTGKVRLTIENTTDTDIELLTARSNGTADSDELRFKLLDTDGNILATQSYKQVFGASVITLTNGQTVARVAAGTSYVSDVFNLNVPSASPNSIRVRLEVDKLRYHTGQDDQIVIAGRGSEKTVSLIDTAYQGEVTDVNPISSFGDQDVTITGRAFDRQSKSPLPNTRLKLVLNQQGFERVFSVLTDAAGNFTYVFKPTITDVGLYKVSAVHPDITDRPEQKAFTINRVTVGPTPYKLDIPKNYPFTIPFTAKAGPGTAATNLRLTLNAANQPTGQIPAGIHAQLPSPVTLVERQTLNIPVIFSAANDAQPSGSLIFDVVSDEHAGAPIGQVKLNYTLSEAKPFLVSTPSSVQTGLAQGGSQIETVIVENKGLQDAANLQFTLTKADGSPVLNWVHIVTQANGSLAIGDKRNIDLSFTPPDGTPEGVYEFKLVVQGDNVPQQTLNVYASLTQSGQGNVLFKAADMYTATIGKDGKLIPGLVGATITLQNEDVATLSYELVTDALGEAMFQNVPAGQYKFRARAANHQELGGRLLIKPGITANQPVFLDYNLITVEWSVREITIQDRYEVTLNATFETDVPAAVVVMQPASINLPKMNAGDVYYGELSLTNYGLIRAEHVKQHLPASDGFFRFEFLVEVPPTLEAKQRVTIPYRVVALQPLEPVSGSASGGGCYSYSNATNVTCDFTCTNGTQSSCGASSSWFAASNSTCGGPGGGGGGGGGGWGGGGFGGGGASTPIKLKGKKCVYVPGGGPQCQ